jgi:hypothetical protein
MTLTGKFEWDQPSFVEYVETVTELDFEEVAKDKERIDKLFLLYHESFDLPLDIERKVVA